MTDGLYKKFARLSRADVDRLVAFVLHDDVLVRGLDKREWGTYRGGCAPYAALIAAVALWFAWDPMGLSRPVGQGLALAAAVLGTSSMVRTAIAALRSRKLLKREEGWVGLAWTKTEFCYRSLELCVLVPWSAVSKVEYIAEGEGRLLEDTLWIHLQDGDKVLIEPVDGSFGGRPVADWARDIEKMASRGRKKR